MRGLVTLLLTLVVLPSRAVAGALGPPPPAMPELLATIAADSAASAAARDTLAADSTAHVPQHDVIDVLAALLRRPPKRPTGTVAIPRTGMSATLLPSVGYNPSYGAFIGVSVTAAGRLGDPADTRISSASAGVSYSTTKQTSVQVKSDFYLPHDSWNFKGDWRYLDTNQPTYGLGPLASSLGSYPMAFVLNRFYQCAYKHVGDTDFFVGFGYLYDRYYEIDDERASAGEVTPFTEYSGGAPKQTRASGVSLNVLADSRDNPVNARHGYYWNASAREFAAALGGDGTWQSLCSDFRWYGPLLRGSTNTLAIWNSVWLTFGHAGYLDLPAIGWDTYGRSGRGYLQGRLRSTSQIYQEFEYRMTFTRDGLLGGVVFLNLTSSATTGSGAFSRFDPGYGFGGRMKFNKITNVNLAVDAARGQDNKTRLFFGLQEVF